MKNSMTNKQEQTTVTSFIVEIIAEIVENHLTVAKILFN